MIGVEILTEDRMSEINRTITRAHNRGYLAGYARGVKDAHNQATQKQGDIIECL